MTVATLGNLTIGETIPAATAAAAAGVAGINGALPDIEARLDALAGFAPQPIDFAAQLAQAQQIVFGVQLGITLGLPVPSMSAQIAAVAALIANLELQVAAVNANLEIIVAFQGLLATAGVRLYAFDGAAGALGTELDAAIAATPISGGTHANALALVVLDPAAWAAFSQVFKVS
jgi:hypothetical protein